MLFLLSHGARGMQNDSNSSFWTKVHAHCLIILQDWKLQCSLRRGCVGLIRSMQEITHPLAALVSWYALLVGVYGGCS